MFFLYDKYIFLGGDNIQMEKKSTRVQAIDGIRGLSLLGILLSNLLIFQYGMWGKDEIQYIFGLLLIPISVLMKCLLYIAPNFAWCGVISVLGANLLAFSYIFAFTLMYTQAKQSFILKGFESIGKLSLTNYLLQSIVFTTIFYGYGLGYFSKLGVTLAIIIGIAFYLLQMIGSYYYLKTAKMGPFEMLLRMWTNFSFKGKATVRNKDISA